MIEDTMWFVKFHKKTAMHTPMHFANSNVRIGEGGIIGKGTVIFSNSVILYDVDIGENCTIGNFSLIRNNVQLDEGVSIGSHNSIEPFATIGKGTRTQGHCMISEFSSIGENVFLGPYFNNPSDNTIGKPEGEYIAKPAKIKSNTRIGSHVVVTPNKVIEENCIIGAGSVVTKSTKEGETWFGSPASKRE